jgi:hypothetical protein
LKLTVSRPKQIIAFLWQINKNTYICVRTFVGQKSSGLKNIGEDFENHKWSGTMIMPQHK